MGNKHNTYPLESVTRIEAPDVETGASNACYQRSGQLEW